MNLNKKIWILVFMVSILLSANISATYTRSEVQWSLKPTKTTNLQQSVCQQGQDFIIQISPFGCTPAVIRSDLLEENDVPVFCQLGATKINPLIDVKAIDSISFSGQYPKEVSGIGFHPAKAALGIKRQLNSPVLENIGYLVIVLRKQGNVSAIPDYVSGNLTAKIKYDINNAFGIGRALFYLPELLDDDWEVKQYQSSFWGGKGSLRAENIDDEGADISVYSNDKKISGVNLKKGETSDSIFLPGFQCQAGLKLKLEGLENPDTRANLKVNAEVVQVAKGEKFLDNKCQVRDLQIRGLIQSVKIRCQEDDRVNTSVLMISPAIILDIDGAEKEKEIGQWLYDKGEKSIYLGYVGAREDSRDYKNLFVYLVSMPQKKDRLSEDELDSITSLVTDLTNAGQVSSGVIDRVSDTLKVFGGLASRLFRFVGLGQTLHRINFEDKNQEVLGQKISIIDFAEAQDAELDEKVKEYYENAKKDYETIRKQFSSEHYTADGSSTFGEEALYNEILLAWEANQKKTVSELCKEFVQDYPNSNKNTEDYCKNYYHLSNKESEITYVTVNKQTRKISFDGIYEPTFEEYGARVMVRTPDGINSFDLRKNDIIYIDNLDNSEIFVITQTYPITQSISNLYFKYNGGWIWSPDMEFWMSSSEFVVSGGIWKNQRPDYANTNLIKSLNGISLNEGKTILIAKGAKQKISKINDYIQLVSLDEDSARIRINIAASGVMDAIKKEFSGDTIKLEKDSPKLFGKDYSFTLEKINLKKLAKVAVIPNIDNTGTQANFSFKVGIEKRAVELSPDRIKKMIEELDRDIAQWGNISESLGKTIEGLKTGCLIAGAALVAKNFISNLKGTGIARQSVMKGTGGWSEKCSDMVAKKTYSSQEQCYVENADKIDSDVKELSNMIEQQNSQIKQLEEGITTKEFLGDKVVDTDKFMERYSEQVINYLDKNLPESLADPSPSGKGETINKNEMLTILSYQYWKEGKYTTEQLRNVELYTKILNDPSSSDELRKTANSRLYSELLDIKTNSKDFIKRETFLDTYGFDYGFYGSSNEKIKEIPVTKIKTFGDVKNKFSGAVIGEKDYVYPYKDKTNGKEYLIVLDDDYVVKQTYSINGGVLSIASENSINPLLLGFKRYDTSSYQNKYKNAKLRYYETEPYKGLPAVVPFDLNNGWYAATKQTLSTGANIAPYDSSARVNSFYLCNVGTNGMEEFQTIGDDSCEMINLGTGMSYSQFPGLEESEAKKIINKAVQAIEQASKLYRSGLSGKVRILDQNIDVGSPAVNVPQYECQDFMSPKECLLLFNLCDPVICPSSRCDLGGAYPVTDVVQSGIIGSIVLCLPNIQEKIMLPVCLTGIKAGIDGFLSIKTSYRDCLNESLTTGKLVGICDEIYSLYLCDFFWRQALPLADMIIPKMVEALLGQNVRGGGEYLGVSNAWDNAKNSVTYFTQYYGANSNKAFLARTTEEFGDEICKLYTSSVYPSGADLLSTLTKADSPPQFHGRFDEISLTTVTVPPTSHYKVFYHIYAGQDSGVYYQVYLKGSTESSYYQDTTQNLMVASGYAAVGGYASETKDFTATSGYTEMCINVNGQEECGFKQVSTSFAVNYIEDKYLQSQASQTDITKESECISGSSSAYSLLNPNLQSAAEEAIDPAVYNRGIIRICATDNPGKGTDAYAGTASSRWKEVGYCDNKEMKCWLDTQSVEDVIETTTVEEETLNEVSQNYLKILENESGYLSEEQFSSNVQDIEKETDQSDKINMINNIFEKIFWSGEKAQLLYLRGNAYTELLKAVLSTIKKSAPETEEKTTTETEIKISTEELTNARDKVLAITKELEGTSADTTLILDYLGKSSTKCSCWDSVMYVYKYAGVGQTCVYSDEEGKTYIVNEETIWIGVTKNSEGETIFQGAGDPKEQCEMNIKKSSISSEEKLENIKPGDILSIVHKKNSAHNVIFIEWISGKKNVAKIFDWINEDEQGKAIFGYREVDLSDTGGHPVYIYWKPYILGQETTSEGTETTQEKTISETENNIAATIYQEAIKLEGINKNAADFVSTSLKNAGIGEIEIISSTENLISAIEKDNNFAEIDVNALKKGDIILLGKKCDLGYSMGIFSSFSDNKISFYTNLKETDGEVKNEKYKFISEISDSLYVYRGYRYIGDLSSTEKNNIEIRDRWVLSSAIDKTTELLKTPGRKNGGKYSDNKVFVDGLIFDGILNEQDCKDVRGWFLGFGQKDMNWLKNVLDKKRISSGQTKSQIIDSTKN